MIPWCLSGKESPCQRGGHGLAPRSGKTALASEDLRPCPRPQLPSLCSAPQPGLSPGGGTTPRRRERLPTPSSCLENSMSRGGWQATVHAVTKSHSHAHFLPRQEKPAPRAWRAAAAQPVRAKPLQRRRSGTARVNKHSSIKSLIRMTRREHIDRKG